MVVLYGPLSDYVSGKSDQTANGSLHEKIVRADRTTEPYLDEVDQLCSRFVSYKRSVPVFGAILLNSKLDKGLLVRGNACWMFPQGKIAKDESEIECAIREVREETGFDISQMIDGNHFISGKMFARQVKLFIIPNVPENISFAPLTLNEIFQIEWHPLDKLCEQLPKKDAQVLKNWILNKQKQKQQQSLASSPSKSKLDRAESASTTPTKPKTPSRLQEIGVRPQQMDRSDSSFASHFIRQSSFSLDDQSFDEYE